MKKVLVCGKSFEKLNFIISVLWTSTEKTKTFQMKSKNNKTLFLLIQKKFFQNFKNDLFEVICWLLKLSKQQKSNKMMYVHTKMWWRWQHSFQAFKRSPFWSSWFFTNLQKYIQSYDIKLKIGSGNSNTFNTVRW